MIVLSEHLWSHVHKSTNHSEHSILRVKLTGSPEIDQLHGEVLIDTDIIRLNISVTDVPQMAISDCLEHLPRHFSRVVFGEIRPSCHFFKEFTTFAEFRNNIYVVLVLEDLDQPYDVRMV